VAQKVSNVGIIAQGFSYFITNVAGNRIQGVRLGSGTNEVVLTGPATTAIPADGAWHHIAVSISRSNTTTATFFVDGVVQGTVSTSALSGSLDTAEDMTVAGSPAGNQNFAGSLDEFHYFTRAVTKTDIKTTHTADKLGECKLLAYAPWESPFWNNSPTKTIPVTLLYLGTSPVSASITGVPSAPTGCVGGVGSVVVSQPTVTLVPKVPLTTPVTLTLPNNAANNVVYCYTLTVTTTSPPLAVKVSGGAVKPDKCVDVPVQLQEVPFGTSVPVQFTIQNTFPMPLAVSYKLDIRPAAMGPGLTDFAFNGMPVGESISGSITIPVGDNANIVEIVSHVAGPTLSFADVLLSFDLNADGYIDSVHEVVASSGLIGTCPADDCPWQTSGCFADYDGSAGIDGDDVIAFFSDFDAGISCADCNEDGGVDGDDVIDFFESWDIGGFGSSGC